MFQMPGVSEPKAAEANLFLLKLQTVSLGMGVLEASTPVGERETCQMHGTVDLLTASGPPVTSQPPAWQLPSITA